LKNFQLITQICPDFYLRFSAKSAGNFYISTEKKHHHSSGGKIKTFTEETQLCLPELQRKQEKSRATEGTPSLARICNPCLLHPC